MSGLFIFAQALSGNDESALGNDRGDLPTRNTEEPIKMNDEIYQALEFLQRSSFRSKFKLTDKEVRYIQAKGIETVRKHAFDFIHFRIESRFPRNDGKQTPMKGHPVFIAQHATATCCRSCIQKWHGIKKGAVLTDNETHFIVDLIMAWIDKHINDCYE